MECSYWKCCEDASGIIKEFAKNILAFGYTFIKVFYRNIYLFYIKFLIFYIKIGHWPDRIKKIWSEPM